MTDTLPDCQIFAMFYAVGNGQSGDTGARKRYVSFIASGSGVAGKRHGDRGI